MTITVVQAYVGDATSTATSPFTQAFTDNVTDGNYIVVCGYASSSSSEPWLATDCTNDGTGSASIGTVSLARSHGVDLLTPVDWVNVAIWYAEVTGDGTLTMEVDNAIGSAVAGIAVMEISTDESWPTDPLEDESADGTATDNQTSLNTGNITAAGSGIAIGVMCTIAVTGDPAEAQPLLLPKGQTTFMRRLDGFQLMLFTTL